MVTYENSKMRVTLNDDAVREMRERAANSGYSHDHDIDTTMKMLVMSRAGQWLEYQGITPTDIDATTVQEQAHAILFNKWLAENWNEGAANLQQFYMRLAQGRYMPAKWIEMQSAADAYARGAMSELNVKQAIEQRLADIDLNDSRALRSLELEAFAYYAGNSLTRKEVAEIVSAAIHAAAGDKATRVDYIQRRKTLPDGWTVEVLG